MMMRKRQPPSKTLLGRAIMFWRAIKGLVAPPEDSGVNFGMNGQTLIGQKVLTVKMPPDQVWKAIWQDIVLDPPLRSIDDARPGEIIGFFSDLTYGRGLYWCHMTVRVEEAVAGRMVRFRIITIDGEAEPRLTAATQEYQLEPTRMETRLTIRVGDEEAGDADMFRNFMALAIRNDAERILKNLRQPGLSDHSPRGGSVPSVPRKNAITRA